MRVLCLSVGRKKEGARAKYIAKDEEGDKQAGGHLNLHVGYILLVNKSKNIYLGIFSN